MKEKTISKITFAIMCYLRIYSCGITLKKRSSIRSKLVTKNRLINGKQKLLKFATCIKYNMLRGNYNVYLQQPATNKVLINSLES